MTTDKDQFKTYVTADTHEQRMEQIRLSEEHKTKRAKYALREQRQKTYIFIAGCFFAALAFLGVVAAIYFGATGGPDGVDKNIVERDREKECLSNGGGWVPKDLLAAESDDAGLCVYPGKQAS